MSPAAAAKKPKPAKPIKPAPFLKWNGGKRQLVPKLLEHVPETFGRYHEPFLGAGALFFSLAQAGRLEHGSYLGDANARLIYTWRAIQKHVDQIITCLDGYKSLYEQGGKELYLQVREKGPQEDSIVMMAAWMIFMNKTCYNGVYRVNKANKFNVPHGRHKSIPKICDVEGLRAAASVLTFDTFIFHGDYLQTVARAKKGDFVYFDPPYAPVSKTANFTGFTPDKFDDTNQRALRDSALALKKKGVHVLISNSSAPIIDELYMSDDFEITTVEARRAVNSKGGKRGPVVEYMIT